MYTRPAKIRSGPATSFATSESRRLQKEQRIVLRSMSTPPVRIGKPAGLIVTSVRARRSR
jgi:hypothetical protein